MLARLKTFSLLEIEAVPVEIELDVSPASLPKTTLVDLPEKAAKVCLNAGEAPCLFVYSHLEWCDVSTALHRPRLPTIA